MEDGCNRICSFLSDYDGDLLELELGVEGQYFFDNMDSLLAESSQSPLQPNHQDNSPLQLTPFVLSVIAGLQSPPTSSEAQAETSELSTTFLAMLGEVQAEISAAKSRARSHRQVATTPRRSTRLQRRQLTTAAPQPRTTVLPCVKPRTRLSSRKQIKRRLF
ncbi:hypothetical protein PRIC1_012850 [Phytophthora ramorum]